MQGQNSLYLLRQMSSPDVLSASLQVNKGVTVVDLLSFARELEAQTDLMVSAPHLTLG